MPINPNLNRGLTEEQIRQIEMRTRQILGSLTGGLQRTPAQTELKKEETPQISSSFAGTNLTSLVSELKTALGVPELTASYQQSLSEFQKFLQQYQASAQRAREALSREKQFALSEAQKAIEAQNRQIASALGLQLGIGSGMLENVMDLQDRSRQALERLALQYDTAIANLDFQTAEQILSHQTSLLNFQNQLNTTLYNLTAQLVPTALNIETLQQQQTQQEKQQATTDLQNILNLYQGKTIKWENLSPYVKQRFEDLSQKTGVPLETIKQYLTSDEINQMQIQGDKLIRVYKSGKVEVQTIPGLTPAVSGTSLTSGVEPDTQSAIINNYLSGFYEKQPGTETERSVIGAFEAQIKKISEVDPALKIVWEIRQNFEAGKKLPSYGKAGKVGIPQLQTSYGIINVSKAPHSITKYNDITRQSFILLKTYFSRYPNVYKQITDQYAKILGQPAPKTERERDTILYEVIKNYMETYLPFDYVIKLGF